MSKKESQLAMKKAEYEGKVFKTNNCGGAVVLEYISSTSVIVKFMCDQTTKEVTVQNLKSGSFSNKVSTRCVDKNKSFLRKYARSKLRGMNERCYSEKYHHKYPSYIGCEISDNFKNFDYFYEWCCTQIGFGNKDWHLDKDILVKGNKLYSEETCCFVPQEINALIVLQKSTRGSLPIGVRYNKMFNLYYSSMRVFGLNKDLGMHTAPEEAFYAYKEGKEEHIKEVANKWKDQIDVRVYNALMNWTIEVTD